VSINPFERCIPSLVVDTTANIATVSGFSGTERMAGAVLENSNAEGSRLVPRNREMVRIVL
jgi:hypothetical protein